ncbi:MAG TPA: iron ABC transporter permease, partial [Bacillota bacterium]|nr:iron ABC transporter permease [Bacillota bacterium]
ILLLLICFVLSISVGRYSLPLEVILELVRCKLTNREVPSELFSPSVVFWSVRLPRAIMALLVGAVLALAGTVFQGVFRNPLVSPDILGVSAGAGFGAGLAIILVGRSALAVQSMAFIFGLAAVVAAYQIGRRSRSDSVTVLVLAGVIVTAIFTAGLSFLKYVADPYEQLPAIVFWTMGGFSDIVWKDVYWTLPVFIAGTAVLFFLRWRLDLLSLGDEEALTLGVDVKKMRVLYISASTLIVASSISTCGTIGWVGLVMPHMARLIVGPNHQFLISFASVLGAIFMLIIDTLARTISSGEIPISIMTSVIGAPFLAYLLLRQEESNF